MRSFRQAVAPIAVFAGPACLLIVVEPDLGTTIVVALSIAALLIAAGMPMRYVALLAGVVAVCVILLATAQPYERARLTSFLHPWASATKSGAGYQAVQGQIALGSGGLFGVGLGRSVQKIFYLPEAQTDFILAVIGEELGVLGILGVVCLYGMIAYAGPADRAPRRGPVCEAAGDRADLADSLPGDPQHLRRPRARPADRRAAAVHLLRADESVRAARRRRPAAEHRSPGAAAASRPDHRKLTAPTDRDRRRRDRRARRAGAGGSRRAAS